MTERLRRVIFNLTPGELTWIACGAVLLAYEAWAVFSPDGDVLTRAWRAHALRWVIVPLGSGFLMGHLNGPSAPYFSRWAPAIGFGALSVALAYSVANRAPLPDAYRAPLFLAGFALGVLTWSGRP